MYTPDTYNIIKSFVNRCRTHSPENMKGTVNKGLEYYTKLIYNNINNVLMQAYPITHSVVAAEKWQMMVRGFIKQHPSTANRIWKMPREWMNYVENKHFAEKFDIPFLNDLLMFEWVEMEVFTMPSKKEKITGVKPKEIVSIEWDKKIKIIEVYRLVQLKYPVHLYAIKKAVENAGDYFLLTFRTDDHQVKYVDMPALHVLFFEQIRNGATLNEITWELQRFKKPREKDREVVKSYLESFVTSMFRYGIFKKFSSP